MKSKEQKREEAEARQKVYDGLSTRQKIARIDARLGIGIGATKERQRLAEKEATK